MTAFPSYDRRTYHRPVWPPMFNGETLTAAPRTPQDGLRCLRDLMWYVIIGNCLFHWISWSNQRPNMCRGKKIGSRIHRIIQQNKISRSKIHRIPGQCKASRSNIHTPQDPTTKHNLKIRYQQDPMTKHNFKIRGPGYYTAKQNLRIREPHHQRQNTSLRSKIDRISRKTKNIYKSKTHRIAWQSQDSRHLIQMTNNCVTIIAMKLSQKMFDCNGIM